MCKIEREKNVDIRFKQEFIMMEFLNQKYCKITDEIRAT